MIHPLLRLLVTKPHLLKDHVEAYAELVGDEVGKVSTMWISRIVLYAAAGTLALLGVFMAGVALLFFGSIELADMPHAWLLLAVPLVPLVLAGLCVWRARAAPAHDLFKTVKHQMRADMAMLREVGTPKVVVPHGLPREGVSR